MHHLKLPYFFLHFLPSRCTDGLRVRGTCGADLAQSWCQPLQSAGLHTNRRGWHRRKVAEDQRAVILSKWTWKSDGHLERKSGSQRGLHSDFRTKTARAALRLNLSSFWKCVLLAILFLSMLTAFSRVKHYYLKYQPVTILIYNACAWSLFWPIPCFSLLQL